MVLHKRIKRVLLENKAQYAGSIMLVILVCFLFTSMTLTGANLQRLTDEFEAGYVQEDAAFTTDKSIGDLEELEAAADAVIEEGKTFDYALSEETTLRIFSQTEKLNLPAIIDGKALSGSGEILINPLFAAAHNYKMDDVITVLDKPFTIAGFVALPNYTYPLRAETDLIYSAQNFGIAVVSQEDFAAFDKGNSFYALKYNHPDAEHPRTQSAAFRSLLISRGIGVGQWTDIADNKRVRTVELKIQTMNMMSRAMPLGLMVLTCIMLGNVLGRMISRESTIIGALYALGYKRKELYSHYLMLPLVLALVGGLIGTFLGLFLVRPVASFMTTTFSMPLTGIDFDPLVILASPLLPMLFLSTSGFFVIQKELRHSPMELMRGKEESNKINFLERALKLEKLHFPAKFRIREQLRSLSRLAFLLVGCAVATMLLLYGFTIKSSLDYSVTTNLTSAFHFQHEYIFTTPHFEQPPAGAQPFSPALFLPEGDELTSFYVAGVTPDSGVLTLVDESGAALSTNQVIMTRPLANRLKVKQGETVKLVRKLDGHPFSLKIDRIADTYVGKYIFMPLAAYNQQFGMPEGSYLGLWSSAPLDIQQEQLYSEKSIDDSVAALKETTMPVQIMVAGYSIVAFIIGVIVIYLVTSMIVEDNKITISLMKIFGYRKREVNSLVLNSSTIVVVIGYIIGVPLILATIGGLLQSLDNSIGLTLPVKISPIYILVGFIVVMVSYEMSKLMCRNKVDAVAMSEALKAGME